MTRRSSAYAKIRRASFFFFQAEDGIRDLTVTGVQTCALPICDRDLLNPNVMRDNMHDWVLANERMARALAAKGYHYQFVFARNAGHSDRSVKQQTLPEALEWLWKGYATPAPTPATR